MNKFLGTWESKLWICLFLYSPLAKLLYLIWIVVTVFPTLWLVCVVLFIDPGKVIWWRALDKYRWFRAEPNHEVLAHTQLRSMRTEYLSTVTELEDRRKRTSNTVGILEKQHVFVCGLETATFPEYSALLWETMFAVIPFDPSALGLSQQHWAGEKISAWGN